MVICMKNIVKYHLMEHFILIRGLVMIQKYLLSIRLEWKSNFSFFFRNIIHSFMSKCNMNKEGCYGKFVVIVVLMLEILIFLGTRDVVLIWSPNISNFFNVNLFLIKNYSSYYLIYLLYFWYILTDYLIYFEKGGTIGCSYLIQILCISDCEVIYFYE